MRQVKIINDNWLFSKDINTSPTSLPKDWKRLNLPYTWNGKDGQDGGNDYYRGKCCFAKELNQDDFPDGEEFYLQFDGVNSSAEVFFNGKSLAKHDGGYSTFRVKLNELKAVNLLAVTVDNSENDRVYPQEADFTFYGGIYRDVSIIGVSKNHFDMDYYGAPGIMVTPRLSANKATVNVKTYYKGDAEVKVTVDGSELTGNDVTFEIENPHLWNAARDPYLYTAKAELIVGGKIVDEISTRFGIRNFEINPQRGFILNGKEYPLRGVSRHQDRPEVGNALLFGHHKEDIDLICEMGANTIRLAHYQHSQVFYDLCDEKGLIVWAEIPYISRHMPNGLENTISQMTELVCQNYNHPCIVTWGLSNEITMGGAADKSLIENHKILNDLVHSLDKTRLTTIAAITMCSPDDEYVHISDVLSYNHYFGWYGGNVSMYGPWFDSFHKKYPDKAIGISEYGCEALDWHTSDPQQGDYTEEYQSYYHEELIKQIMDRKYLWSTYVWNMFDFAADARCEGGENGMNHKGLVSFDRKYKKDSFYAYKAWLSDEPFVHICSKRYIDRVEDTAKVTVYTNQNEVELFANGKSVKKQKRGKYPFFHFYIKNEGETTITAKAGECEDSAIIRKVDVFNEKYRMVEEGAVINWFELTAPSGYFSINDTLGDIMSTFRGKLVLLSAVPILIKFLKDSNQSQKKDKSKSKGMSAAGFKINKTMIDIAKGFSLKRALSMLGVKLTKEQILNLNKKLNKIKKGN